MPIETGDREILRDLARRAADAAARPEMAARRREWVRHNALRPGRPMILVFPEGAWRELLPDASLACRGEAARRLEGALRMRLAYLDLLPDDTVLEREWRVPRAIRSTGWGLEPRWHPSPQARGARGFDPVIHGPADLKKLRFPEAVEDEAESRRRLAEAQELLGDLLDVRPAGPSHFSFHLMAQYTALRGLEQVMLDMYEEPAMLHDAMAFFEEGSRRLVAQYFERGFAELNNDGSYHSSGGVGYSDELPAPGYDGVRPRPVDVWASAEAQELAQVSPEQHEEFSLRYERRLLAPFGLNGYGCCEDLTPKLPLVLTIPRLRRVSISPFADVERCAAQLGRRAILSWKPHPSHLVGAFDEAAVGAYLRRGVAAARAHGCALELILKDTHTCEHRPERFTRWCRLAREAIGGA